MWNALRREGAGKCVCVVVLRITRGSTDHRSFSLVYYTFENPRNLVSINNNNNINAPETNCFVCLYNIVCARAAMICWMLNRSGVLVATSTETDTSLESLELYNNKKKKSEKTKLLNAINFYLGSMTGKTDRYSGRGVEAYAMSNLIAGGEHCC